MASRRGVARRVYPKPTMHVHSLIGDNRELDGRKDAAAAVVAPPRAG